MCGTKRCATDTNNQDTTAITEQEAEQQMDSVATMNTHVQTSDTVPVGMSDIDNGSVSPATRKRTNTTHMGDIHAAAIDHDRGAPTIDTLVDAGTPKSKQYNCPSCPKSFGTTNGRKCHVYRVHGVKSHVCLECGYACTAKLDMRRHTKLQHE